MCPIELVIKDTPESNTSASYFQSLNFMWIGRNGLLYTSFCDKCDDFNFHITTKQFISIP